MRYPIRIFRAVALMFTIAAAGSLLSGCSETPTAGPGVAGENAEGEKNDPGPAPEGQSEPEPDAANEKINLPLPDQSSITPSPANPPTHIITQQAVYYKAGPQQAIPPDGKLEPGTKVSVVREAGSYCEIKAENGIQGYVTTDSLKLIKVNQ